MCDRDRPVITLAPALPMTTVPSNLNRDGHSERDVWAIIHDTEFAQDARETLHDGPV
jgi:hypothetical protein